MGDKRPWWADDPELAAIRRGVMEELERAVLKARAAGLSWGEIGRVLGVSKQQLHRRFSRPAPTEAP